MFFATWLFLLKTCKALNWMASYGLMCR